ncbi:hypothetical protein [Ideonella livida]|uniref:Uncharacterized protein n=1 Tax=Ideonella livida TaxID=2707176 RepID=A0A7C9PED2_9BURK|nr:hypothetical protein [Ideonella livida]NDY89736.1 hypothetical protein [Ideonella livida]
MYLKADFDAAIAAAAANYPAAKAALAAKDPTFLASLDAMAAMLAMISAQVSIAETEWATKARDGTVLADAALRGVLPLAKPARVEIIATNSGPSAVTLATGRGFSDPKGRTYALEGGATVAQGGTVQLTLRQTTSRTFSHSVSSVAPFAEVIVPESADDAFLVGLSIADAAGNTYRYVPGFHGVEEGERVFAVEVDEYRRVVVRFGATGITGYSPIPGEVLTVTVTECLGAVGDLADGAAFALDYLSSSADGYLDFTLADVVDTGANPPTIAQLRVMAAYPGVHDDNPVYRGQWDYYLRRHLGGNLQFLAVWNEQVEEQARGASPSNINRLFVAASVSGQSAAATNAQVAAIVGRADDSYQVSHVEPRECQIPVTVTAAVPAIFDPADVETQIRSLLLQHYGKGTANASQGLAKAPWRQRDAYALLGANIAALKDTVSDYSVSVGAYGAVLPEDWRYVADASITVTVSRVSDSSGLWTQ